VVADLVETRLVAAAAAVAAPGEADGHLAEVAGALGHQVVDIHHKGHSPVQLWLAQVPGTAVRHPLVQAALQRLWNQN